ncbi:glycosyltransferase family 4 protein [Arthrobacter sp. FW306-2-2C-D06B]|uniref:glycosyltransferase family 4 protein n=1 Tax=Arthrobacter sp. FW306-2-2C-D06B TaxID=2879618 RepID=UPI001F3C8066|nr:glycosyltransferase family 4 protein [Arthrobacter sp. FW306-2-2C-D06B]
MLAEVLTENGANVRIFSPRRPKSRILAKFGLSHLQQTLSMRRELRHWEPQIVVSNGTLGFFGRNTWKHIHVFHGTMVAHSLSDRVGRSFKDWLIKGIFGGGLSEAMSGIGATRVAVSQSCAAELKKYYGYRAHQVIPNGVRLNSDVEQIREGLIFVGRRESRKGYEMAVELAMAVKQSLSVAGPGDDPRTRNLGVLDETELQELYSRSKAMVFPSNYEACSFAVLEALTNGCAVITTKVGWIPELLSAVPEYERLIGQRNNQASFELPLQRVLSGDAATMSALEAAVSWTRENNSFERFSREWTDLINEHND